LIKKRGVQLRPGGAIIQPEIRFLGIFDTVSSHGYPGNKINIGYDLRIGDHVDYVAHATANDETRHFFPSTSIHNSPDSENSPGRYEDGFPGAHSDVGGGYDDGDLSDGSLVWMWKHGVAAGAPFGPLPLDQTVITNPVEHREGPFQDPEREVHYPKN